MKKTNLPKVRYLRLKINTYEVKKRKNKNVNERKDEGTWHLKSLKVNDLVRIYSVIGIHICTKTTQSAFKHGK